MSIQNKQIYDLEFERVKLLNEILNYRRALEHVKRHNSDTVTNDRRIRHIIGEIVDKALGDIL